MPDCPDDIELAGFLNESLTDARLGYVCGHVDGCPRCQERLDRLTEQAGGPVARYKELSSGVLPDSRSLGFAEENTLVLGSRPSGPPPAALVGLPHVPGFDLIAEIGRGGMGVVYKARHRRFNRLVALKMILAGTAADPRVVQRFLFEAEVLARIQHPQVVQVFEVDTYQGPNGVPVPYLAMELLPGGSLGRLLRAGAGAPAAARWPSPRAAAELVEGLARAVHAAHLRGVVHRDLKPGNILFPVGGGEVSDKKHELASPSATASPPPKVVDFGLAKFTREAGADLTQSGLVIGTPQYMAPEQAAGNRDIGPGVDVYALGAILFECLAGRPPFSGPDPVSVLLKVVNDPPPDVRALEPNVPRDLAAVTMKCLEKDPLRRYPSAEALADDLRRFLDDRPTRARPVRTSERVWLWARRNPAVAGLMAALALVLVVGFATVAVLWVRAEQKAEDEERAKQRAESAEAAAVREAAAVEASLREVQRQKALLEFGRAVTSCEEGRVKEGLALFLRAAEIAEQTGQTDLARAARINLAAWPRSVPPAPRPFPHAEQPRFAAFHPDGRHLVTAGRGHELHLWDAATGKVVRTYKPHARFRSPAWVGNSTYWTVALSPDGTTIAAGGTDRSITLWALTSEEPVASFAAVGANSTVLPLREEDQNVWAIAFTSNTVLWSNDGKDGLKRWDVTVRSHPTAQAVVPKKSSPGAVLQILVGSADGKRLYSGDRAGVVREWDAEHAAELRSWSFKDWITDVAVSADGKWLAATGPGGVVERVDLITGLPRRPISLAGAYGNGVAFAPERPYLATADGDGNVRFWHRETGQPIGIPMRFHGEVTRPRFRPNSGEFAVPAGNAVYLSGLPDPPGTLISAGHGNRIRGLDFSPTGDRLAVTDESAFALFDPLTGTQFQEVPRGKEGALTLHFDPVRPFVYRGTRSGFDRIAIPAGQRSEPAAAYGLGRVFRIDSPRRGDGLFIMGEVVVARYDPVAFKAVTAKRPATNLPAGVALNALAVRPDGGEVLVSFADRIIFLHPDTLEPIREWRVGDELFDARYTPDGTKVLIGRRDNAAELLHAATGAPTSARPMTHTRAVTAVAVSPDGAVLLTGSRDGTARFWDATTGLPLGAPLRHSGPVTHVAFAPNGGSIATGTDTGHTMVWGVPPPPSRENLEELGARWK